MILKFKTARNANGHRKYLAIDTGAQTFTKICPYMIVDGIEIKTKDYNELIYKLVNMYGFTEKERI